MKLFQLSWLIGILTYVVFGVFRRAASPVVENESVVLLPLTVLAGIGIVLGVMSWIRKEAKAGWIIVVIVLNLAMLLTGIFLLLPGN